MLLTLHPTSSHPYLARLFVFNFTPIGKIRKCQMTDKDSLFLFPQALFFISGKKQYRRSSSSCGVRTVKEINFQHFVSPLCAICPSTDIRNHFSFSAALNLTLCGAYHTTPCFNVPRKAFLFFEKELSLKNGKKFVFFGQQQHFGRQ